MIENCGLKTNKFAVEKIVGWVVTKATRSDTPKRLLYSAIIANFGSATPYGDDPEGTAEIVGILPADGCYKVYALDYKTKGERKELGYIMGAASQPDWEELRATWLREKRERELESTKRKKEEIIK